MSSPLYRTARWEALRELHLAASPLCGYCLARDIVTEATVCDHIEPHRGDVDKFWAGPFQSLCATCHSDDKQREELGLHRKGTSADGWPLARM